MSIHETINQAQPGQTQLGQVQSDQARSFEKIIAEYETPDLGQRHQVLDTTFKANPSEAMTLDEAHTTSDNVPGNVHLYTKVTPGDHGHEPISVGTHSKVGGNHDFANPGEILCAAIAACYDSSIRMVSCRLGIDLLGLSVKVIGNVDVRGTLKLDKTVPTAFQGFDVVVDINAGPAVDEGLVKAILNAAEESCVVMQTLLQSPPIAVEHRIAG